MTPTTGDMDKPVEKARAGKLSRRGFLRLSGMAGAATAALAAGCAGGDTPEPTPTPTATQTPTPTRTPAPTLTPTPDPANYKIVWPKEGDGAYVGFYDRTPQAESYPLVLGEAPAITMGFTGFDETAAWYAEGVARNGSVPLITLELRELSLRQLASGEDDDVVRQTAIKLRGIQSPLIIRPMHEMNGNWDPWHSANNGANLAATQLYVDAWRYVHGVFREEGVANASWLWTPNWNSVPDEPWNRHENYYPGDEYVDLIGVDGYNSGVTPESEPFERWMSFDDVHRYPYDLLTSQFNKPYFIGEFACGEQGGDKAAWIRETFQTIKASYPRIAGLMWFSVDKERDWRIDSSPEALDAFADAMSDPYYLKKVEVTRVQ